MIRIIRLAFALSILACSADQDRGQKEAVGVRESTHIVDQEYELFIPERQEGLLILFPCFPCDAEHTKTEFNIVDRAIERDIAVLLMNFNQHLYLSRAEKVALEALLVTAISDHGLKHDNAYIGGFSSGGNVALLLGNYLKSSRSLLQAKGLFIADSPIDLLSLYENAQRTLEKNFSTVAMREARWIVDNFELSFGAGDTAFAHFNQQSPYLYKTHATHNLAALDAVDIRLYSEPDTSWWKENRRAVYEDMNAFYIEQLAIDLGAVHGQDRVRYIQSEGRGYRSNGERHPHSWAIIDEEDLLHWVLSH